MDESKRMDLLKIKICFDSDLKMYRKAKKSLRPRGGGEKNNQSCKGQMCTRLLLLVSSSANNLQGLGPEYRSVIRVASKIIV